MKALGIMDRFASAVLDGSKPFTLRRAWRNGRTPEIGERLSLVLGSRTPARRVFATCIVGFRATVLFRQETTVGLVEKRSLETYSAEARRSFVAAEAASDPRFVDHFAALDGFSRYAAFWAFHGAHREAAAHDVVSRELIGLCAVSEAFTNA